MKLTIPTSQSEIPLRHYIQAQDKPEREQIAIYLNLTTEQIEQLPAEIYDEALLAISKAMQEEPPLMRHFTLGQTEYGFIPDLNDIESGAFAIAENNATDLDGAAEFLNALYRPIKRKVGDFYSVKGFDSRASERMLDAPLSAYTGSLLFFYLLGNDLGIYTQNSTPPQASKGTQI